MAPNLLLRYVYRMPISPRSIRWPVLSISALVALYTYGSSGAPAITVINESDSQIVSTEIMGSHFIINVGVLAPGAHVTVIPEIQSESTIDIRFVRSGIQVARGELADLRANGGLCADIRVTNDGVRSQSRARCFRWRRLVG